MSMLSLLCPAALAEYNKCDRPAGKWAGFDQGIGRSQGQAVIFTNNHVYVGGHASGEVSFGSSTETGDYHDHLGTKSGPNAHDTHLDVTIHHDTASFAALAGGSNTNALNSQLGQDSFIYKMDADTGKPSSVYAMDTVPIDGNLYGNGTNGRWGGWSYINGLDTFDLSSEMDHLAAIGMVRGRLTFPGTPSDKELTNSKNGCYDPWVAKINVATSQVVWATKEKIEIPAPADPEEDCQSAYPASVVTTAAGHVITGTYSRHPGRKYSGQFTKFDGASGAFVWQKDFGLDLSGSANGMSSAGGEKVIYTSTFKGQNSNVFAPLTSTSCEGGESKSAAIACFDVSATDAPIADWVVTMCGEAVATFVQGDYVYAVGELSLTLSTTLAHAPGSTAAKCTMTGDGGGYLVKLQKSDGKCVWAKDVPEFTRVVADANSVWGMTSTSSVMKFDANNTVTPNGRDLIMGKFSASDGTGHWAAAMGGASTDRMYDMTMTPLGPVAVGYSSSESTTVGDVTVSNLQQDVETGQNALFVIQLSSTDKKPSCIDQCPSGSLLDATVKAGNCYADDVCIANGAFSPSRPCFRCDSATKQKALTGPLTDNHCYFDDKCVSKGTMAPAYSGYNSASVCETCNPDKDPNQWSVMDGWWHDRSFVKGDDRSDCQWTTTSRGGYETTAGPCAPNSYGILFTRNTAGCQMMPDVPITNQAATALATNIAAGTELARITSAIGALKGDATSSAETAAAWYQGKAACEEPKLDHDKVAETPDISTGACVNTPAAHADAVGLKFGTNMHYGHSIARIKTQQALALLYNDLDKKTVTATQTDIEKDIVAHMLVPLYQGAIEAAHRMDTAGTAAAGLADGAAYWGVIKTQVKNFDAGDRARLTALFEAETPRASGFNYCECKMLLMRNLPYGSMLQYGQKDHVALGGRSSGPPVFNNDAVTANTQHASTDENPNRAGNPLGQLVDAVEAVHLQARDIGELTDAPTCTAPPPTPPPPTPPTSPAKSDLESASSTLSEGEIAGIAVGAAVGGIVVLVAVGLVLRTLLVRDAKPTFSCLEKAPAEKNAPAVDKNAPAVDANI